MSATSGDPLPHPPRPAVSEPTPAPRVLLVDDDPVSLRICSVTLRAQAYEVVTARSGAEAVALDDRSFDLVVVDLHMPGLDGWDTVQLHRARQLASGAPLPCYVALTTDDSSHARQRSRAFGIEHHLVKPAGVQQLNLIAHGLGGAPRTRAGPPDRERPIATRWS